MSDRAQSGRTSSGAVVIAFPGECRAGVVLGRPAARGRYSTLLRILARWRERARVRGEFRELAERAPDSVLADARISREDAAALGRRPFWLP